MRPPGTCQPHRLGRELAAYKRISRVELSDAPLPKTPRQKVARGGLEDAYKFDLKALLASGSES